MFLQASVVLLCFGLWVAVTPISAQNPKRLEPVRVIGMEEIDLTNSSKMEKSNSPYVVTRIRDCYTRTGIIGYILELMSGDSVFFEDFDYDELFHSEGYCISVGLTEVQRAEQLLVDELNRITDELHFVPRRFTAPWFYQYMKQYIFYRNTIGDTCVRIKLFAPHESRCPDLCYMEISNSRDVYSIVSLNLSSGRLMYYRINEPTLYYVKGRCKERFGLSQKGVFPRFLNYGKRCLWDELPRQVQEGMLSVIRESDIYWMEPFHPKVKRGLRLCELSENYYVVKLRDGSCDGFDSKGRWAYTEAGGFGGTWKEAVVSEKCVPAIDKMLAYIGKDLEARGIDFSTSGLLRSVEKVKNHYVLVVECKGSLPVDGRKIAYTFNRNGHLTGMDIRIYF